MKLKIGKKQKQYLDILKMHKLIKKKILCTICARKGSKGLRNKNFLKLLNKPLILYSIQQAKNDFISQS